MMPPLLWKVALISTDYDLKYLRDPVAVELKRWGFDTLAFEQPEYPVAPHVHSHNACLEALDLADIVVVIVDQRRGGLYVSATDTSITEAEYDRAMKQRKIVIPCVSVKAEQEWYEKLSMAKDWKRRFRVVPSRLIQWLYPTSYVQSWEVLQFIQKLYSADTNNFRIKFDNYSDLIAHLSGRLAGLTRYFCHELLRSERERVKRQRTTTGLGLSLGDVIDGGYYTEPDYREQSGQSPEGPDLTAKISLDTNANRVLVLGEPGSGKSTLLAKCFISHSEQCLKNKSPEVPLFLTLRELGADYHFDINRYYGELFEQHLGKVYYPKLDTQQVSFVTYIDGLDELAEQTHEAKLKTIIDSDFFKSAFIVCSRTRFAQVRLDGAVFGDNIDIIIELQPWSRAKSWEYVTTFFKKQGRPDLLRKFERAYKDQPQFDEIERIMQNPLSLTMFLWIIKASNLKLPPQVPDQIELYDQFLELWAQREYDRFGPTGIDRDQLVKDTLAAWRVSSWLVYRARFHGSMIKTGQLRTLLEGGWPDIAAVLAHNAFWDFFDIRPYFDQVTGVFHEQFMEHLLAETIVETINSGLPPFPDFLDFPIRYEVNRIIKSLWGRSNGHELKDGFQHLTEVYDSNLKDQSDRGIARRNHAVYYLGRMPYGDCQAYLKRIAPAEQSYFVKSSIAFSLIMMEDLAEEEEFYSLLVSDSEMDKINRGYHLVYYGDWGLTEEQPPYRDEGKHNWPHTLAALKRHLQSTEKRYVALRRIELYTMRRLLETRQDVGPVTESAIQTIESCALAAEQLSEEFGEKVAKEYKLLKDSFNRIQRN